MKSALKIVVAVCVIVIIGAAAVWLSLDALLKRTIESRGSRELGVNVELGQANLKALDGELTLSRLKIDNPEGYEGKLFETIETRTTMRPLALFDDEVVIDTLVIDSPSLDIEHSLQGTNLAKLLEKIQPAGPQGTEPARQKTFKIKRLEINGARVSMSSSLTARPPVVVSLPDIELENVSNADGGGLTLAQVFEKVLVKMAATAFRTGKAQIPAELLLNVSSDLTPFAPELEIGIPEKAKGLMEKAQGILKDLFKGEETPGESGK